MAIGSGLSGQIGFKAEGTYGTAVTVDRFLEFNKESIKADLVKVESRGIGTGRMLKTARRKTYVKGAKGSVEFDVQTKGFGLIFKHMLGTYANTNVAGSENRGRSTVDLTTGKAGLSLTCQVGRPGINATVYPYTYEGAKIVGWEFAAKLDDPLRLSIELDCETEQRSDGLASASYTSGTEIFVMSEGGLTLAGSAISVKGFNIKGVEGLAVDRRFIGNTKKEPLANSELMITGQLEFEHEAQTRQGQWLAGTEIANLIATFTSPTTISGGGGAGPYKLILNMPLVVFDDSGPVVDGPDIVKETIGFKVLNDGSNSPITIDYHSTDSAAT